MSTAPCWSLNCRRRSEPLSINFGASHHRSQEQRQVDFVSILRAIKKKSQMKQSRPLSLDVDGPPRITKNCVQFDEKKNYEKPPRSREAEKPRELLPHYFSFFAQGSG